MSQQNEGSAKGYVATAALLEGYAVKLSSGQAVVATAATDKIIGVTQGKYAAGETASIKLRNGSGTVKVKLGGTVAVGDRLTATTDGRLIATTTAANEVVGFALEVGAANDFVEAALAGFVLYAIS
jgi:hypothetical protein